MERHEEPLRMARRVLLAVQNYSRWFIQFSL
jgi:hypothetical protein